MIADRIVDKFVSVGLMTREYDRVKLHVTLMNTLMRKDPNGVFMSRSSDRRATMKNRESFDATGLLRVIIHMYFHIIDKLTSTGDFCWYVNTSVKIKLYISDILHERMAARVGISFCCLVETWQI